MNYINYYCDDVHKDVTKPEPHLYSDKQVKQKPNSQKQQVWGNCYVLI